MIPLIPMRRALSDPDIFGTILPGESWAKWRILLIALMGEKLTPAERIIYHQLTDREQEPGQRVDEAFCIIGRRGGKSRAAAVLAAYLATMIDYSDVLAPGERASLPILSATIWQSRKLFAYLRGIFESVPVLAKLVQNVTADTISLKTRVDLECRPASFRSIRGGTACAAICDELAFWRSDEVSANPDTEILNALRPSLATTNGPLICISSPYSRRGELYLAWKRDKGPNGDPLIMVAQAATLTMNSVLNPRVVERAFERDPSSAISEYGDENVCFRSDLEDFISEEIVEAITYEGRFELPYTYGLPYVAFVDMSGGMVDDSALAIAHKEGDMAILDCIRVVKSPSNPDTTVHEFSQTLKQYHLIKVTGDRYGGSWPASRFAAHGITYEPSEHSKSEIFTESLPSLMGRRVELLQHDKLQKQLIGLERRTTRGTGRDIVDHPPGQHDDVANAVCGALALANGWSGSFDVDQWMEAWAQEGTEAWRQIQIKKREREERAAERKRQDEEMIAKFRKGQKQ